MRNKKPDSITTRRRFIRDTGLASLALAPIHGLAATAPSEGLTFAAGPRRLVSYPGKREMILVHSRPPHLETPFSVFDESVITPNDAFFVRYHLADFPTSIDLDTYRLAITGHVASPLNLSLDELKSLTEPVDIVAVNQCSGNSRGYSSPRVFGAQLGNGAMGNARWTGVPLRAVLEKAGVKDGARQVVFNGLDKPVMGSTPDFRKALEIDQAMQPEPMLAWGMNGEDLPFLNGYPLKLIVPGYFGTYWVKHLAEISVIDHEFEGHDAYFMTKGYRLPDNDCNCVTPGSQPEQTRPIAKLAVRSFITSVTAGDQLPAGRAVELRGIAFDGGSGINSVELSADGGGTWQTARLGEDLGQFSFREWRLPFTFRNKGMTQLLVRATSRDGAVQPVKATWNPGGYLRNVIESTPVVIV